MKALKTKCIAGIRFMGICFLLTALYWIILIYIIINDGTLKNFRYMGF